MKRDQPGATCQKETAVWRWMRLKELSVQMQVLLHQWWMGCLENRRVQARPHQASFLTARAPGGSPAKYLDNFSPVEDIRKRLRELRAPVWGTNVAPSSGERDVIERQHLEDQALRNRRRRDLRNAIVPNVARTFKGPDAPTESEDSRNDTSSTSIVV